MGKSEGLRHGLRPVWRERAGPGSHDRWEVAEGCSLAEGIDRAPRCVEESPLYFVNSLLTVDLRLLRARRGGGQGSGMGKVNPDQRESESQVDGQPDRDHFRVALGYDPECLQTEGEQ